MHANLHTCGDAEELRTGPSNWCRWLTTLNIWERYAGESYIYGQPEVSGSDAHARDRKHCYPRRVACKLSWWRNDQRCLGRQKTPPWGHVQCFLASRKKKLYRTVAEQAENCWDGGKTLLMGPEDVLSQICRQRWRRNWKDGLKKMVRLMSIK